MPSVKKETTIREYQDFVNQIYGLSNDRYFSVSDMLSNIERFLMRGLRGIRKGNKEKTKHNLLISHSWFMSLMSRLHIDIEEEIWQRFPYLCSYCVSCPCVCKVEKIDKRQTPKRDKSKKPKTLKEYQKMFEEIYPAQDRTLDHAGVHLAEEMGEFSEAMLTYRGRHEDKDFEKVSTEAADFFSCLIGIFNSLEVDVADELAIMFVNNCHVCKNSPCTCTFNDITEYKS